MEVGTREAGLDARRHSQGRACVRVCVCACVRVCVCAWMSAGSLARGWPRTSRFQHFLEAQHTRLVDSGIFDVERCDDGALPAPEIGLEAFHAVAR